MSLSELIQERAMLRRSFADIPEGPERRSAHAKISALTREINDAAGSAGVRRFAEAMHMIKTLSSATKKRAVDALGAGSPARKALGKALRKQAKFGAKDITSLCAKAGCLAFIAASVVIGGDASLFFYTPDIIRDIWEKLKGEPYTGQSLDEDEITEVTDHLEGEDELPRRSILGALRRGGGSVS